MSRRVALLALFLLLSSVLVPGLSQATERLPEGLEQAILAVRAAFPDQDFYDRFESRYQEIDGRPAWALRWYSSSPQRGELIAGVDGLTGEIIHFSQYKPEDRDTVYAPLPAYTQAQARAIAEEFLNGLVPEKLAATRCLETAPPRPTLMVRRWQMHYHFTYVRYAHDIPFPANVIKVVVNGDTGVVTSYDLVWNDLPIPKPNNLIGEERAKELFAANDGLELRYVWPYSREEGASPFLAYYLPSANNLLIDAHTGRVVEYYYGVQRRLGESVAAPESADMEKGLLPHEIEEIQHVAGLLTQAQAVRFAREELGVPQHLELIEARLLKTEEFHGYRYWQLTFADMQGRERYDYWRITLDAATGELLAFNSYEKHDGEESGFLTPEAAEALARQFITIHSPDKAGQLTLNAMPEIRDDKLPLYYSFNYTRYVNDVPFPQNGVSVVVKASEKPIITSYNLRWLEADFPAPVGIATLTEARERIINEYPLELEYRLVKADPAPETVHAKGEAERRPEEIPVRVQVVLAYRTAQIPGSLFTAGDVAPINWNGKAVPAQVENRLPEDVDGHWAAADIRFLAEVGVVQTESGRFGPNSIITVGEWLEMLSRVSGWHERDLPPWAEVAKGQAYERTLRGAIAVGLILPGDDVDLTRELSREELAVYAIRAFGYEHVAAIPGIYRVPATDAADVSRGREGHVAMAIGLELLVGRDGGFRPQATATRAECAVVLMRMLRMPRH